MLHPNDFRSLWDLAHLWEGYNPDRSDPANLPEPVVDKLQKLIWGYIRKHYRLRSPAGYLIQQDDDFLFFFNFNRTRVKVRRAAVERKFDKRLFGDLFVMRSDVLRWCEQEYIAPPAMWASSVSTAQAIKVGKHKTEDLDKQLCQAIAQTLWELDPNIHPAHMANSRYIRVYGNGGSYVEETLKGWLAEVDPLADGRKTGRPKKTEYLIDLKIKKGGSEQEQAE